MFAKIDVEDDQMIKKIIDKHLEKMAEDILDLNDKNIKKFLKETKDEGAKYENQVEFMKTILSQVLAGPDDEVQGALYQGIDEFLAALHMHSDSYLFEIELKDDVIKSTREIRVPGYFLISDLAYAVMAAYGALGNEEFSLEYKGDVFKVEDEFGDAYPAHMIPLGSLDLKKNDRIDMIYDFEEKWEFVIRFKNKRKTDFEMNIPELIDGEGYNIWEDSRDLLRKLIENPMQTALIHEGEAISVQECAEGEYITPIREDQIENFLQEILEFKSQFESFDFPDYLDEAWDDMEGSGSYQA